MTKAEFLAKVQDLYRTGNISDDPLKSDDESWTLPAMAGKACCEPLDRMLLAMKDAGILTADEVQEFHDTL